MACTFPSRSLSNRNAISAAMPCGIVRDGTIRTTMPSGTCALSAAARAAAELGRSVGTCAARLGCQTRATSPGEAPATGSAGSTTSAPMLRNTAADCPSAGGARDDGHVRPGHLPPRGERHRAALPVQVLHLEACHGSQGPGVLDHRIRPFRVQVDAGGPVVAHEDHGASLAVQALPQRREGQGLSGEQELGAVAERV